MFFLGRDADQTCAAAQRGFAGQTDRAAVTLIAADREHVAVESLVHVAPARRQARTQRFPFQQCGAGGLFVEHRGRQLQRGQFELAAGIGAGAGVLAALPGDEADRRRRTTQAPSTAPVSADRPDGISSASIGTPLAFKASTSATAAPCSGRFSPMP